MLGGDEEPLQTNPLGEPHPEPEPHRHAERDDVYQELKQAVDKHKETEPDYPETYVRALEENPEDLLHTSFRFEPVAVVPANASGNSFEQATLDRFENKFVNILQFRDYAFRRVN